jgi:7-cyano-7-deazaguanine synthase
VQPRRADDERAGGDPAVVLLSGGLDSATTLALAGERGFRRYALTVDYGQRHALEIERAAEQARRLGAAEHRVVRLDLGGLADSALLDRGAAVPRWDRPADGAAIPPTYVPARNTLLLALALAWAETLGSRDLFIGANAVDYSGYPDCRPEFLAAFEALAARATRAGIEDPARPFLVHAPLVHLTKGEIVREAARLGVDVARTLSCYDPDPAGRPCGRCDSCGLRAKGFAEAGLVDPALRS